jgi:hypothetical protein
LRWGNRGINREARGRGPAGIQGFSPSTTDDTIMISSQAGIFDPVDFLERTCPVEFEEGVFNIGFFKAFGYDLTSDPHGAGRSQDQRVGFSENIEMET